MNKNVHYFNKAKIYEEYYSILSKTKYSLYKNNNDTIKIFISTFLKLKLFVISLWDFFISYISSMKHFLYKLQFILLLQVFLFSFITTFEGNANISTDLIISAYFPKNHITRISYEVIKEEENKKNAKTSFKDNNYNNNNDFPSSCNENVINFDNIKIYNKSKCYQNKTEKNIIKKDLQSETVDKHYSNIKNEFYNIYNGNLIMNKDSEVIFIYNITIRYLVINFLSFSLLYSFIKFTLNSKIRGSLIFNLFCILISFNLLYALYRNEYYLSSNFFFILIVYINKNMIDSIYIKLKYKRKDFEIFSTSLMAFDSKQFHLKFILLILVTIGFF